MLQDEDQVELNAYTGIVKVFEAPPTQKNLRIKGKVFYKGKVSGQIVNVKTDDDLTHVNSDSIVVAYSVTPQFLSALYCARGFIVDEYSLTSHAYLFATALQIPAVGGTRNASTVLQTGDSIVLDAEKGEIIITG